MENTVNSRVLLLKKELGLSNNEFCMQAKISTSTLYSIQNGVDMKSKTITAIAEAFNINKDWLLNGKGKMLNEKNKETTNVDPWKDALVSQVKEENNRLQKEVERLWQMVSHFTGGAKPNFLNAIGKARLKEGYLFPNQSFGSVSANV